MKEEYSDKLSLKDDWIFLFTDDTGMLQHSIYGIPDRNHGYTTDDNARALIMALLLYERDRKKKYLDLIYRYSSFLFYAQNGNGKFRNFMGYDRKWLEEEGSDDCFGRCIWAVGFAISNDLTPKGIKNTLSDMLKKAIPHVSGLTALRSKAYALIGLSSLDTRDYENLIFDIGESLCRQYEESREEEWDWFENMVTYCNYVLPWSLLAAYQVTEELKFLKVAEKSLKFLEKITFKNGFFKPVGCKGWLVKHGSPAAYDEQAVEACEAILIYKKAWEATGKKEYLQKAKICYEWYEGSNSKGISLIDRETGGCHDGLTESGMNLNMGAESLVSYVISHLVIEELTLIKKEF